MEKCPHCNKEYAKYPLWEIKEDGTKKPIIRNWIIQDSFSIFVFFCILLMTFGYYTDTKTCRDTNLNPEPFCTSAGYVYNNITPKPIDMNFFQYVEHNKKLNDKLKQQINESGTK